MRHHHVAAVLHAVCVDAHEALVDLFGEVLLPTLCAECVPTGQALAVGVGQLTVADGTVATVLVRL